MNEHRLPDDYTRWPRDPHELLGVPRSATARDIKRAYTHLIRQYKPEHAPEQFRLIRQAYESAARMAEYLSSTHSEPIAEQTQSEPPPEPTNEIQAETTPPQPEDNETAKPTPKGPSFSWDNLPDSLPKPTTSDKPKPRYRSVEDQANDLWNMAISGDPATAYQGLVQLVDVHPQRQELYAQLYWLLALHSPLDTTRQRLDWLFLGLERTGLEGSLLPLYVEEFRATPDILLAERSRQLLIKDTSLRSLGYLVNQRWREFLRRKWLGNIERDLQSLRHSVLRDDGATWLQLMVLLLDWLAWETDKPARQLRKQVRHEVAELETLALREGHWFDRIEYGVALVQEWNTLNRDRLADPLLCRLIRESWYLMNEETQPTFEQLLDQIDRHPHRWLHRFDELHTRSPFLFQYLSSMVDDYAQTTYVDTSDELPSNLWFQAAQAVLWGKSDFRHLEQQAFRFCLNHNIEPSMILASYTAAEPDASTLKLPGWLRYFMDDPAMTLVLRMCWLFRRTQISTHDD